MDTQRVWHLLERGGVPAQALRPAVAPDGRPEADGPALRPPKYDGLADPAGADELGRALAERARPLRPTAILIWEDPQDIALAQVVGRELEIPVIRSFNADGLVGHSGPLAPEARVLLLADLFRDPAPVRAMALLVAQQGATVVGTAVLVETPALVESGAETGVVVSLARARD